MYQFSIFDLMKEEPVALFKVGDILYQVKVNKVLKIIVSGMFICGDDYRYHADYENGNHKVFGIDSVGIDIFSSVKEASEKALDNNKDIISLDNFSLFEQRSFSFSDSNLTLSGGKPFIIYATVGKIDNLSVYIKDWYTYSFVHVFTTEKAAASFYQKCLDKILEQTKGIELDSNLDVEEVYLCKENLYSSYEYFNYNFWEPNKYIKKGA